MRDAGSTAKAAPPGEAVRATSSGRRPAAKAAEAAKVAAKITPLIPTELTARVADGRIEPRQTRLKAPWLFLPLVGHVKCGLYSILGPKQMLPAMRRLLN